MGKVSFWEKVPIMDKKFRNCKVNFGCRDRELQLAMAVVAKRSLIAVTAHTPFNPLRRVDFYFNRPK